MKKITEMSADDKKLNSQNKEELIKALVHAADVGNPTRPFDIALAWGKAITVEFFS